MGYENLSELRDGNIDILIIGDVHGNLEGMINAIKNLERIQKMQYNLIFQVGDFDIPLKELKEVYLEDKKIFFIRGNHEQFDELSSLEENYKQGAIPIGQNFFYLPDSRLISIDLGNGEEILLTAYGGIDKNSRQKAHNKDSRIGLNAKEIDDSINLDVLLTHQGPEEMQKGSSEINALVELIHPKIHLHGHSHISNKGIQIGETKSYSLERLPKEKAPKLAGNYFGILSYKNGELKFEFNEGQQVSKHILTHQH